MVALDEIINKISTHTLRGERDLNSLGLTDDVRQISTHTLRGERDKIFSLKCYVNATFQLTRSVGSVTKEAV